MPDITMTRQSALRGQALQTAINTMMTAVGRRAPFNTPGVRIATQWESAARMTFSGNYGTINLATGSIDVRDGNPSTITAQVNLYSAARNQQAAVERAMVEESDRYLQPVGGSAQTRTAASSQTSAQTSAQSGGSSSGDFDWNLFANILGTVVQQAGTSVQSYNQAVGYTADVQARQIAAETAASSKQVPAAPAPRPTVVARQSAALAPDSPIQGPAVSTVGWIIIGAVGLGVVGFLAAVIAKKSRQNKKDED
jgi:hypothetical protein